MMKLSGVGPIIASAVDATMGNPTHFKNGRHFAAFLGLVPKEHSSGGKQCFMSISKRGDRYIRSKRSLVACNQDLSEAAKII
nr:transposase [Legionella cincinnatiensis]